MELMAGVVWSGEFESADERAKGNKSHDLNTSDTISCLMQS